MNRIVKNLRHYLPDVTLLAMAVAALLLVVSYDGGGVFGGPDSCQQPQAIRDALENATGLACAEIGSADLGDIRVLDLRGTRRPTHFSHGSSFSHRIGKLQPGAFNGLENLARLDLRENRLTELPPSVFDGLENLRVLDLSHNGLTELPPSVFDGLENLRVLNLSLNGLTELPPSVFDGLENLRVLNLSLNGLTELPSGVLESLTNLEVFDLRGNDGEPFTITHPNADLDCLGCVVVPR